MCFASIAEKKRSRSEVEIVFAGISNILAAVEGRHVLRHTAGQERP